MTVAECGRVSGWCCVGVVRPHAPPTHSSTLCCHVSCLYTHSLPPPPAQAQARSSRYRLWEEQELIDLCGSVGLEGYKRIRSFRFIMYTARKPD